MAEVVWLQRNRIWTECSAKYK